MPKKYVCATCVQNLLRNTFYFNNFSKIWFLFDFFHVAAEGYAKMAEDNINMQPGGEKKEKTEDGTPAAERMNNRRDGCSICDTFASRQRKNEGGHGGHSSDRGWRQRGDRGREVSGWRDLYLKL